MSSSPDRIARFGVFELNPRTGELRKRGARVRLQDQPFQVLSMLVERAGDLVTREEVRERPLVGFGLRGVRPGAQQRGGEDPRRAGRRGGEPAVCRNAGTTRLSFPRECRVGRHGRAPAGVYPGLLQIGHNVRLTTEDRTIVVQDGTHIIGRDPDAAVWIDSAVVSRRHAQLLVRDGRVSIEDLAAATARS